MALTQPILKAIPAFDATQAHIFSFLSIGGDQVTGSQLTIYDNETGLQVYQGNYTSFKFEFPLASGTLTNGKYYNATIATINISTKFSTPSTPVAFYCYTAPSLTITNVPATGTIGASNYQFQGNYIQREGELLNGYEFNLYDNNKNLLTQSGILYDGLYQYTFSGLSNDTAYYIELTGSTINNTSVTSGLQLFTVRYIQPASFAICDLANNCDNGYVQISSNIVAIDGTSEPDPPLYINNKEVDLRQIPIDLSDFQNMNNWQRINGNTFTITYDSSSKMNNIQCATTGGWEILYIPLTTITGRTYTLSFNCTITTPYIPTTGYNGIAYQILNSVTNSNNLSNSMSTEYLPVSLTNQNFVTTFVATSTTTYFAINFGMAENNQNVNISLGNFSCNLSNIYVDWAKGFNIQDDFTMRIWGRAFGNNEKILNMTNELNTASLPNKIEIYNMQTTIEEELPIYINAKSQLINVNDSIVEPIKNLEIDGNTLQQSTPTPISPSLLNSVGDVGNLINISTVDLSYTDSYYAAIQPSNKYILLPNRIYTLTYDYVINNSTTDAYFSIGYGNESECLVDIPINETVPTQYATQNKGTNTVTFQTPTTFTETKPYLWLRPIRTIISATMDVTISNVSLFFGTVNTYQSYNQYNIPITIGQANLYNLNQPLYLIDNNTTHLKISGGYEINLVTAGTDSFLLIGINNNLIYNQQYTLTYQTLGAFSNLNLYSVNKGTSTIVNEISLTNGTFVAPSNFYDLMIKITLDNVTAGNNMNIWNIQIIQGNTIQNYTPFVSQEYNLILTQPLRGIGNIRDLLLMNSVNLVNPSTLSASVTPNTTYYFSNNITQNFLLEFKNSEGNLINTLEIQNGSFTTPDDCVLVTSTDFDAATILSEKIQIELGNSFTQYLPYISQPSIIRNFGSYILSPNESWSYDSSHFRFYANKPSDCGTGKVLCSHFVNRNTETLNYSFNVGTTQYFFRDESITTLSDWKTFLTNNNIEIVYQLSSPSVISLTSNQILAINSFNSYLGNTTAYTNTSYHGYVGLSYSNGMDIQDTLKNYMLLKCWSKTSMPYIIHSNYITINNDNEKIFIWVRKNNNLFDLKIENLGEVSLI